MTLLLKAHHSTAVLLLANTSAFCRSARPDHSADDRPECRDLLRVGYDARESGEATPEYFVLQELSGRSAGRLTCRTSATCGSPSGPSRIRTDLPRDRGSPAISVAISTRSPMVANVVSRLAIFVVGHLTPVLVQSGELQFEVVEFMARLIATAAPNLDSFNVSAAVATGQLIPPLYLLEALVYSAA